MTAKLHRRFGASHLTLARALSVVIGLSAIAWGTATLPAFWADVTAEQLAQRILLGNIYRPEVLALQQPILDRIESEARCRPGAVRSAAIIQIRATEDAARRGENIEGRLASLRQEVDHSLGCAPADPLLWLVRYWVQNRATGTVPGPLTDLELSYRLGPNEGWIAVKRSPITFAQFETLPPDLRKAALDEFIGLVKSGFFEQAADIFLGPASVARDLLLPRLGEIPLEQRRYFAEILRSRGYQNAVPGIELPDSHRR